MFIDSDFNTIFAPAVIVVLAFIIGYKFWVGKQENELDQAITLLKISTVTTAFLLIVLWLMLPVSSTLSSVGLLETIENISSNEQLRQYLQTYDNVVVRTTTVLRWFIFIFVWGFLTSVYSVLKTFSSLRKDYSFKSLKE